MQNLSDEEYWNTVGSTRQEAGNVHKVILKDNWNKRGIIMSELCKHHWYGKSVVEIGSGHGILAASMRVLMGGNFKYTGTDISDSFLHSAKTYMRLYVMKAKSNKLPIRDSSQDAVWMFDVLEHIPTEERKGTYSEIYRVLKPNGLLIMNSPLMESAHKEQFEYGLNQNDTNDIEASGLKQIKRKVVSYYTPKSDLMCYLYEEFMKI